MQCPVPREPAIGVHPSPEILNPRYNSSREGLPLQLDGAYLGGGRGVVAGEGTIRLAFAKSVTLDNEVLQSLYPLQISIPI